MEVGSETIATPGQDYYRYQEWKLGTFPRGFRLARISANVSQTASWTVVGPPLPPLILSLCFSRATTQSPFLNTNAAWRGTGTLIHVRLFVCFVGGSVQTVDARREVIISLSHLIISANYSPEYSPRPALTSVHGYRAGVGVHSPLPLAVCAHETHPLAPLAASFAAILTLTVSSPLPRYSAPLRTIKMALNRSTICLAAWSN